MKSPASLPSEKPTGLLTEKEEVALVREIYDNFPEASLCLSCTRWKYEEFDFRFTDEDGHEHEVNLEKAVQGLRRFIRAVVDGKLPGLGLKAGFLTDTGDWDGFAFDAVNQMAIYGEVIYG